MSAQPLRVWAPVAGDVVAVADGAAYPMVRGEDGWWSTGERFAPGTRYAFGVDGGPPRPDPRSLSQPDGVHEASEVVDLAAYEWGDADWRGVRLQGSSIYELHVGTFTDEGTLGAAVDRLDHLVDLGVTTVQLMPVAAFPGRHGWGYDGVALYAVHAPYGGPSGLLRFVDAAHQRGLAVYLDVVYNHWGPSGNYLAQFGPYFTDRHETPWGDAVNLDGPASDEVRDYLLDNVRLWLRDYHLDGLRLDAVHALHDERALPLLEEIAALADQMTEQTGIPRTVVAESDRNDPATVAPRGDGGAGGLGLHGQWADDVHHALHALLTGEADGYYADFADPRAVPKVLGSTPFFHDGTFSTFRGRRHGRAVDPALTPGWRFVASLQTHDQIGNRAGGDRIGHALPTGTAAIGAALLLTSPYTPMLFMGEEWGASTPWQFFTDHSEPELVASIREGRSAEFAEHGWAGEVPDPQDEGTVRASRLRWAEVGQGEHAALLDWYRQLLRLRREVPEVLDLPLGAGQVRYDVAALTTDSRPGGTVLVQRGRLLVAANTTATEQQVTLAQGAEGGGVAGLGAQPRLLARWGEATWSTDPDSVRLGPHSCVVLLSD